MRRKDRCKECGNFLLVYRVNNARYLYCRKCQPNAPTEHMNYVTRGAYSRRKKE